MAQFRKKTVVIEAIQYTGDWPPIIEWLESLTGTGMAFQPGERPPITRNENRSLTIPTLQGDHLAGVGDWIIQGVKGELCPCKAEIFAATYEPVLSEEGTKSDTVAAESES